jgi:hypothetical protein
VLGSFGHGQGGTAALIRFTPEASSAVELHRWLLEEALPAIPRMAGFGSTHLLQGAQAAAMTNEQRIRGVDRGVDLAIVLTGYDRDAVSAHAESLCAADALPKRGARELASATYSLSYSLTSAEIDA